MRRYRLVIALLVLLGAGGRGWAGQTSYRNPQGYAFYEVWWREYRSDRETALLLHVNVPQSPPWARFGDAAMAAREAAAAPDEMDALLDGMLAGGGVASGPDAGLGELMRDTQTQQLAAKEQREGRYVTEAAPEGVVYDYSPNRGEIVLPGGIAVIPGGRFGAGLELDGSTGLSIPIGRAGELRSMEGWFKPAALPAAPVCLLAGGGNGARLLLHPDGRLELAWFSPETRQQERIRTDEPIRAGEWTHIAAYSFLDKHIEYVFQRPPNFEIRIGINGVVGARFVHRAQRDSPLPILQRGPFFIGMNPEGGAVYTGLVDEVRVSGLRRYQERGPAPRVAAGAGLAFGPPRFRRDARVVHAAFESPELTVHPEGQSRIAWDPAPFATFADMQVPGVQGQALLIDPALGFPRLPIRGMSIEEGTFEWWFQPVNWDNHTDFGEIRWSDHTMSVARFMGRDTESGQVVPFMEIQLARATIHGEAEWIHPGQWSHFIWTWSPGDVHTEAGWGTTQAGDPISTFRAFRFGNLVWRAQLMRNIRLIGRIEPLYLELGITDDITVIQGQRPAILVDEVIGHSVAFSAEEIKAAPARWGAGE